MCLAIPVRIQDIEGSVAQVELGGVLREVSLILTPEAEVGDYVLVHTGFAINVLDEKEAQETLRLFAEMEEAAEGERALSVDTEGFDKTSGASPG
ncbi:MAG: HypC/HybG/HupF family hydrogenase formation chaperone [Chloroflexota bacterium]|nr:HypC/HybG/HupF family hydrogenase formation chaperone [Chloroflexota bacterium]